MNANTHPPFLPTDEEATPLAGFGNGQYAPASENAQTTWKKYTIGGALVLLLSFMMLSHDNSPIAQDVPTLQKHHSKAQKELSKAELNAMLFDEDRKFRATQLMKYSKLTFSFI